MLVAENYATELVNLERLKEAKSLLRKTMPVARRILGDSTDTTLRMRWIYAEALYKDPGATLDDVREAVTTLEDTERIARRVLGGAHPLTVEFGRYLQYAQAVLRVREGAVESLREAVAEMMPGDAQGKVLAPTA